MPVCSLSVCLARFPFTFRGFYSFRTFLVALLLWCCILGSMTDVLGCDLTFYMLIRVYCRLTMDGCMDRFCEIFFFESCTYFFFNCLLHVAFLLRSFDS